MRDEVPKRNVLQMFDSDEYFLVNIMVTNEWNISYAMCKNVALKTLEYENNIIIV